MKVSFHGPRLAVSNVVATAASESMSFQARRWRSASHRASGSGRGNQSRDRNQAARVGMVRVRNTCSHISLRLSDLGSRKQHADSQNLHRESASGRSSISGSHQFCELCRRGGVITEISCKLGAEIRHSCKSCPPGCDQDLPPRFPPPRGPAVSAQAVIDSTTSLYWLGIFPTPVGVACRHHAGASTRVHRLAFLHRGGR